MRNCNSLWRERHSGFRCFLPFCAGFFPSLWIYPPVICVVADFSIGSLSGCPDCWWWSISVTWFSFYQSSPSTVRLLRSTPGPAFSPGAPVAAAEQWGMLPVSFSAIFVSEWCLPNVSLLDIEGSGSNLRRQSVPCQHSSAMLGAPLLPSELLDRVV